MTRFRNIIGLVAVLSLSVSSQAIVWNQTDDALWESEVKAKLFTNQTLTGGAEVLNDRPNDYWVVTFEHRDLSAGGPPYTVDFTQSTGVLLSPQWVVTAFHNFQNNGVHETDPLNVVLGRKIDSGSPVTNPVDNPEYQALPVADTYLLDGAGIDDTYLVKLQDPVPIGLVQDYPTFARDIERYPGQFLMAGGYGMKGANWDPVTGVPARPYVDSEQLRWGRGLDGVKTDNDEFASNGIVNWDQAGDYIPFEFASGSGDSGGLRFVRRGWEGWQIDGISPGASYTDSPPPKPFGDRIEAIKQKIWEVEGNQSYDPFGPADPPPPAATATYDGTAWDNTPTGTDIAYVSGNLSVSGTLAAESLFHEGVGSPGTVTQNAGSAVSLGRDLFVGSDDASDSQYLMFGGTLDAGSRVMVGYKGQGEFYHLGGTVAADQVELFGRPGERATYTLAHTDPDLAVTGGIIVAGPAGTDAELHLFYGTPEVTAAALTVGGNGDGRLKIEVGTVVIGGAITVGTGDNNTGSRVDQTGGSVTASTLRIAQGLPSDATYDLSGAGSTLTVDRLVLAKNELGSPTATGTFIQSGTTTVTVNQETVLDSGGTYTQTGGSHTTAMLNLAPGSSYLLDGATLTVTESLDLDGTLDLGNTASSVLSLSGLSSTVNGTLAGLDDASLSIGADSLLTMTASQAVAIAATNGGNGPSGTGKTHITGTALDLLAGENVRGAGAIVGDVTVFGTGMGRIQASEGGGIDLTGSLTISEASEVDLGDGTLTAQGNVVVPAGATLRGETLVLGSGAALTNHGFSSFDRGVSVESGGSVTSSGQLESSGQRITVKSGALVNSSGTISSELGVQVDSGGVLISSGSLTVGEQSSTSSLSLNVNGTAVLENGVALNGGSSVTVFDPVTGNALLAVGTGVGQLTIDATQRDPAAATFALDMFPLSELSLDFAVLNSDPLVTDHDQIVVVGGTIGMAGITLDLSHSGDTTAITAGLKATILSADEIVLRDGNSELGTHGLIDVVTGLDVSGDYQFLLHPVFESPAAGSPVVALELMTIGDGDANDNGLVEQGDLNEVLNNWGELAEYNDGTNVVEGAGFFESGDLNGSGLVEQGDLNVVLNNWGDSTGSGSGAPARSDSPLDDRGLDLVINTYTGEVSIAGEGRLLAVLIESVDGSLVGDADDHVVSNLDDHTALMESARTAIYVDALGADASDGLTLGAFVDAATNLAGLRFSYALDDGFGLRPASGDGDGSGDVLSTRSIAWGTGSIEVVPEPAAVVVLALFAGVAGLARRRAGA